MRLPITQQHHFGCGAACVAFVAEVSYRKAVELLGIEKAVKQGFTCQELVVTLQQLGWSFTYKYINAKVQPQIYQDGTIVFIKRSKKYPVGHYLVRYQSQWMDPWINFYANQDISDAQSGWRDRLPGKPIYVLIKKSSH